MASKKKLNQTIKIKLPTTVIRLLEYEISKKQTPNSRKLTKSDLILEAIFSTFVEAKMLKNGSMDEYNLSIEKIRILKQEARRFKKIGRNREARRMFLLAAAYEFEALAILDAPSEPIVRSTMVEISLLVKESIGYRSLPIVLDS